MLTRSWKCAVTVAVMMMASTVLARAETITIENGSFESPTTLTDDDGITGLHATPDSWTKDSVGDCGMFSMSQTAGPGPNVSSLPDGTKAIWGNSGYVYQELNATLKANTTYTLTAYAGARSDLSFTNAGSSGTLNMGYGSDRGTNLLTAATSDCVAPSQGGWNLWTVTFVTGATPMGLNEKLRVEININGTQQLFDNVQLTASTIPEPSTLVMMLAGIFGLMAYAWRKRK